MRRVLFALFLFFAPLLNVSAADAEDVWWAQQINENDWTEVVAPEGWQIAYIKAWYGSPDGLCGADVSDTLAEIALDTIQFEFVADNNTFGDSCPGVYKVFRFTWGIVPLPDPIEPPVIDPPVVPEPEPTVIPIEPPIVEPPVVEPPIVEPEPPTVPEPPATPEVPIVEPVKPVPPVIIPPVVEPPVPVPTDNTPTPTVKEDITEVDPTTIDPTSLSDEEVAALITVAYAVLESSEPGSAEYEQALGQLFVAAQADDFVVDPGLASVPLLGDTVVALADAVNYLGNVGADMSPRVRKTAQKEVVAAVILTQIATQAAGLAVSASIGGASSVRRMR